MRRSEFSPVFLRDFLSNEMSTPRPLGTQVAAWRRRKRGQPASAGGKIAASEQGTDDVDTFVAQRYLTRAARQIKSIRFRMAGVVFLDA